MMNDTVARIVEIMFQDVEMNEETEAIRDEVMNNCQERYSDLVNSGMADDDAIAAVIESLKGMDDVLAPYKKKVHRHVEADDLEDTDDEESGEQDASFASCLVSKIDVSLVKEDIRIEASNDDCYHVLWDSNESPLLQVELRNDVLRVELAPGETKSTRKETFDTDFKFDTDDFVKAEAGKIEINMDSISRAMKSLGDKIKMQFSNGMSIGFGSTWGSVTIQVPENAIPHVKLLTTSGDIDVQDVTLADLNITSTSGDINIALDEDQRLEFIEMRTTSGDMEVNAYADRASVSSTSGDMELNGQYTKLSVGTISGDIDVRADVSDMNFSAVSGDVELEFESNEIRKVCGSTISGDIEIELPEGLGVMGISTQTRSGDATIRYQANGVGPTVSGGVSSMSGDITIR